MAEEPKPLNNYGYLDTGIETDKVESGGVFSGYGNLPQVPTPQVTPDQVKTAVSQSLELGSNELAVWGAGNQVIVISTNGLQIGHRNFASAPFSVDMDGNVVLNGLNATSGTIGGFSIGADYVRDAANTFGLSSTVTGGDDVRWWAGSAFADRATAPGRIHESGKAVFENVEVAGTLKSTVFQKDVVSAVGGKLLVANAGVLDTEMTALDASTLTIKEDTSFAVNDILHAKNATDDEYLRVTDVSAAPEYTVTRDLAGSYTSNNNPAWPAGTAFVVEGQSDGSSAYSGGFLELLGAGGNSPKYSVYKRTGLAYNAITEYATFGNLNDRIDYTTDEYGVAIGSNSEYMAYDTTNGLRIEGAASVNGTALGFQDTYGDGSDGDVTISADTSLSRDMFYNNLTINSAKTLDTNGYRVFVKGTLTVNGTIGRPGNNGGNGGNGTAGTAGPVAGTGGSAGTAGGALASGSMNGAVAGTAGTAGANGITGDGNGTNSTGSSSGSSVVKSITAQAGTAGGAGGAGGTSNSTKSGGTAGTPGTAGTVSGTVFNTPKSVMSAYWLVDFFPSQDTLRSSAGSTGGTGGCGGSTQSGSGGGTQASGGGGGGGGSGSVGGIVAIFAKKIVIGASGLITARGGNGGNGGNGGAGYDSGVSGARGSGGGGGGGGAAGSGGVLIYVYSSLTNAGSITASAGTPGTAGTGGDGSRGADSAGSSGSNGPTGNAGVVIALQM